MNFSKSCRGFSPRINRNTEHRVREISASIFGEYFYGDARVGVHLRAYRVDKINF